MTGRHQGESLAGRIVGARWNLILLGAIMALGWPLVVEKGIIVQCDYPSWASIANMLDNEVFPECRWFWAVPFARINAGEILGQPYSLSIVVPWLLMRVVSVEWAFKLIIFGTYLVVGFGFYCFAAPKTGRLAASLGAYLLVLENLWHINHGMWYNSASIGLAFFFLVVLERFADRRTAGPWVTAAVLLALTVYAHPLGTLMAFCGWLGLSLSLLLPERRPPATVLLFVWSVPLLALGLAFPQVVATAMGNITFAGGHARWSYSPFQLIGPGADILVLLGALFGFFMALRRKEAFLWIVVPPLLAAYAVYRNLALLIPVSFPFKGGLAGFADRFSLVASAMLLVLFARCVSGAVSLLAPPARARRLIRYLVGAFIGCVILAAGLVGLRRTTVFQPKTVVSDRAIEDHEDFLALCAWIAENIDHERERVYVEDTYGRKADFPLYPSNALGRKLLHVLGREPAFHTHYLSLISLLTQCRQVNGFPVYKNPFGLWHCCDGRRLFGTELPALTPEVVRERMWLLNCNHIIAFSRPMSQFLSSLGFLRCSRRFGRFCVFSWSEMEPHYAWSGESNTLIVPAARISDLQYELDLGDMEATTVYMSIQYHGNWKAYADERPVAIRPWKGLMQIALPAEPFGTLRLRYELNRTLPLALVACSALCLLLGAVKLSRHRAERPPDSPHVK